MLQVGSDSFHVNTVWEKGGKRERHTGILTEKERDGMEEVRRRLQQHTSGRERSFHVSTGWERGVHKRHTQRDTNR